MWVITGTFRSIFRVIRVGFEGTCTLFWHPLKSTLYLQTNLTFEVSNIHI